MIIRKAQIMAHMSVYEPMVLHTESKGNKGKSALHSYCKKPGHYRDKCWVLHGRPNNHEKSNRGGGYYQQRRSENAKGNNELRYGGEFTQTSCEMKSQY